ncbi:flagellar basal body-associated protein FliL [Helicobacter sp. MIT 05-5293]|uniref:Flagellar protein FliL n=1 Tax=uncultured Helicobacter sp. TaxID=175537 RepID=A0A650ELD7_9HELI|nr:flagellar basal body-associated protein FliL [Helicobacter sp. MIT 05-5293]QGT50081.1 hypothetical protein Helico4rc_2010 [uncultured Helicobacter sp.]TLD81716.1 flagellar basal body-associated protein FliL [Helicobacter sp. MIT 05-5293]
MAEEEKAAEKSSGEKKSKAILFVVIGIVFVLLLLIGILVAVMLGGGGDEEAHNEAQVEVVQEQQAPTQQAAKIIVGNTVTARSSDRLKPGPIYPIPTDFTVNLMTQTGKRYLKTSISLEIDKPETEPEITTKLPIITDTIIEILSSKSLEDVSTAKGKNRVKDEIVKRINEFLLDGQVRDLFFTQFVVS